MSKPKRMHEKIESFCGFELDGPLQDLMGKLQELMKKYGHDVYLTYESEPWDDGWYFVLYRDRDETPEEETKRIANDADRLEQDRAREIEEMRRLVNKYGEDLL